MAFFRAPKLIRRRRDGQFELALPEELRETVVDLLDQVQALAEDNPDDPALRRLHPPAYLEDLDHDAGYQLLAGEELRASRRSAVETVRTTIGRDQVTEDDLWAWLRALNALRLVVGTRLDISEDDTDEPPADPEDPTYPLWAVYGLATQLQFEVISALGD